jgi:Kyakuja-Dileera-Zisupton transposase
MAMHITASAIHFLATYVKGMGLEDLEGGERYFSKSNALASSVGHASVFHRKQKIVEFAKHMDQNKTYQNLSE